MAYNYKPFFSKISIQGKNHDELSYTFSSDTTEQKKCSVHLFGVFAISSSHEIYQQFIKQTIKHFVDFYNHIPALSHEDIAGQDVDQSEFLFENAIQYIYEKVTSALIEFQEERKRSTPLDIKKIHCILGCLSGDTLFVSSTGTVLRSYYIYPSTNKQGFTRHSIAAIIDQQQEEQSQRLFSNVISGAVGLPGSIICITTLSLLDYLSLDQLKQHVTTQQPELLSSSLEKMLGKVSARNDISALFIHPTYTGTAHNNDTSHKLQTAADTSMEVFNSRQRGTDNVMSPTNSIYIKKMFSHAGNALTKLFHSIVVVERLLFQPATWKKICALFTTSKKTLITLVKKLVGSFQSLKGGLHGRDKSDRPTIRHSFMKSISSISSPINNWGIKIRDAFLHLSIASRFVLILSVLFITLFIYSLFALGENQKNAQHKASIDSILQSLQQKYSEADARLIFQNDASIFPLVNELKQLIDNLPNQLSKEQQESITSLRANLQTLEQKLNHSIIINNPTLVVSINNVSNDSLLLLSGQGKSFLVTSNQALYLMQLPDLTPRIIATPTPTESYRAATLISPRVILASNASGTHLNRISDDSSAKPTTFPLGKSESQMDLLNSYNGNLYNYDSRAGTIFKHMKQGNGFSLGYDWIRSKSVDLREILDLDIDGTVYILKNSNQLFQFINGKPHPLPLPIIQPQPHTFSKIETDTLSNYLFLLEPQGNRIIVLDKKTLELKTQLTSPIFSNLIDLQLSMEDKSLLILNGSSLYRIPLEIIK